MKNCIKNSIAISLLFCFHQSLAEKYVIGGLMTGFFANFIITVNHLLFADRNNKTPVVYWDREFLYFQEGVSGDNAWEHYFEPVSKDHFKPGDIIGNRINNAYNTYWAPNGFQLPYNNAVSYTPEMRKLCSDIIKKYIKIKPSILNKAESFYNQNMLRITNIGLHLRGTDKHTEVGHVDFMKMFKKANQLANKSRGRVQFFVATDDEELLKLAIAHLNRKVISAITTKSQAVNNLSISQALLLPSSDPHYVKERAVLGEEALIDALLLSKCSTFLHSLSLMSQTVVYFNAHSTSILFNANPI